VDVPEALASAAAGMRAQSAKLDAIAENLANAGTVGYRARRAVLAGFAERLESTIVASTSQGGLRRTGVPTDLALVGPGAFAFAATSGVEYSRDGRLQVDPSGYLCDARGRRALGALGPARFPRGAHVDAEGRIVRGGLVLDRLRVVDERHPLTRGAAQVRAGYLEDSGVDPIAEMTALVGAERAYEANQKSAQRADESLRRAVTDVPAVRP
jgi:flagellar basal-body rod protein FlgF